MPALGPPIIRQLRRMATAYDAAAGRSNDPIEVVAAYEAERARTLISRRELLRRGAVLGRGRSPPPRSWSRGHRGPVP